jgi:hypothetical protein
VQGFRGAVKHPPGVSHLHRGFCVNSNIVPGETVIDDDNSNAGADSKIQ